MKDAKVDLATLDANKDQADQIKKDLEDRTAKMDKLKESRARDDDAIEEIKQEIEKYIKVGLSRTTFVPPFSSIGLLEGSMVSFAFLPVSRL